MNKYSVIMDNNDICKKGKRITINAVSCDHALKLASTYNKGFTPLKAIRIGETPSTVQVLNTFVDGYKAAKSSGDDAKAGEFACQYHEIVGRIKSKSDIVRWQIASKFIPKLY